MRKILLVLLFLQVCMFHASANPVTAEKALQKAKIFLQTRQIKVNSGMKLTFQCRQMPNKKSAPAKDAYYYVFNNGNDKGFVIVSGDDCAEDVLGYTDKGTFNPEEMPEQMQAWLDSYAEQIATARANGINTASSSSNIDMSGQVVEPLLQSHWNQDSPYNTKCPKYNNVYCKTGCMAVVLSQIMHYHKWPVEATTAIPSYQTSLVGNMKELPAIKFDWDNIKDTYTIKMTENKVCQNAVATLLRYAGQSVQIDYGKDRSGAEIEDAPNALYTYFGFKNKPILADREEYTTEEWKKLIIHELRHARPVILGARGYKYGHAFICDGYDGHEMFHINWGWGGLCDGYFRLQALNSYEQDIDEESKDTYFPGYSFKQRAVIGISPTIVTDRLEPLPGIETNSFAFMSADGTVLADKGITNTYDANVGFADTYIKYGYSSSKDLYSYDVAIGLFSGDQMLEKTDIIVENYSKLRTAQSYLKTSLPLGTDLPDGTYQIRGIDCIAGTGEWVPSVSSELRYIEVKVANGKYTMSIVDYEATTNLVVTGVEQLVIHKYNPRHLRVYLHNYTPQEAKRSLYLLVDNQKCNTGERAYIPANSDGYVDFVFKATAGSHNIKIAYNESGTNLLYNKTFRITNAVSSPSLTVTNIDVKNVEGYILYGRKFELRMTLKNESSKDYHNYLYKFVNVQKPNGRFKGFHQHIEVYLAAGEKRTFTFTHDFAIGDRFYVKISDQGENNVYYKLGSNVGSSDQYDVYPAFVSWTADGTRKAVPVTEKIVVPEDAVAASFEDIEDLSSTTITRNSNKSTIYYFAPNATIPKTMVNHNVVRGDDAYYAINFYEGTPFYVPQSFNAYKVKYTCKPTLAATSSGGWKTITLPFAVQNVTSNGKAVDWYRNNDTEEKDFWLREFRMTSGNMVKFANVSEWIANTPYIFAVPGNYWGEQYDLTNKLMEFSATNTKVMQSQSCEVTTDAYDFIGTTSELDVQNVYVLNAKGNAFEYQSSATLKPTEAFFVNNSGTTPVSSNLYIAFDDLTDITLPQATPTDGQMADVYTIDGRKMTTVSVNGGKADLSQLPHGIYIVNGKKIVK